MSSEEHKKNAPGKIKFGIVTVSSTRNVMDDDTGNAIEKMIKQTGHKVMEHAVVPDIEHRIIEKLDDLVKDKDIDAIVFNGGTGLALYDVTVEAVRPKFKKEIIGFNSLFMSLSYLEVGASAMLSRATAGVIEKTAVFCIPGSPSSSKLAMEKLILPEIGHIVKHLRDIS